VLPPNAHLAEIDPQKLHGYLLSKTHPVGRFKARFFAALGDAAERWQELALIRSRSSLWRPPVGLRHWSRFIPPIFAQLLMTIWWRFALQVQQIDAMASIACSRRA